MSKNNGTPKIKVQKINGMWGCAPVYMSEGGDVYTQKHVQENRAMFECDTAIKPAKKKSSESASRTPSNRSLGSAVLGESGYGSQLKERFMATAELLSQVNNEVAL